MEILSIGRISQTRKIAALCGKEGKIVMKKKKSEFGAYAIGWLYLLAPVIILAVVLVVKYYCSIRPAGLVQIRPAEISKTSPLPYI